MKSHDLDPDAPTAVQSLTGCQSIRYSDYENH